MSITIAQIETDVVSIFHAAIVRAKAFLSAVPGVVHTVVDDAQKAASVAEPILAAVAPQDLAALKAVEGILSTVDAAVQTASHDVTSANSPGLTVTLPAELVALFKSAKDQLVKYESSL